MAFPYLLEEGFELGTLGSFDVETDTAGKLDFPSYRELARSDCRGAPYRGAYCMRVDLSKTPGTDAYVQETGTFDTSAAGTLYVAFAFYISSNYVMANTNEFAIFQLWSGTNTDEGSIVVNYTTANGLRIGLESPGETSAYSGLIPNQWHWLELKALVDSGVGNDGTLDLYVDGTLAASLATIDQGAITSGVMGAIGLDAGTTKGTILFDQLIVDDALTPPPAQRFPQNLLLTKTDHAFVGPGRIDNVSLISGAGTDCTAIVYDTDRHDTADENNIVVYLANTVNAELVDPAATPVHLTKGAYVVLAGTNPRALVRLGPVIAYGSDGAIRNYGAKVG